MGCGRIDQGRSYLGVLHIRSTAVGLPLYSCRAASTRGQTCVRASVTAPASLTYLQDSLEVSFYWHFMLNSLVLVKEKHDSTISISLKRTQCHYWTDLFV